MKYRKMCFNAKNKISELNRSGLFLAAAKTAVPPGKNHPLPMPLDTQNSAFNADPGSCLYNGYYLNSLAKAAAEQAASLILFHSPLAISSALPSQVPPTAATWGMDR